MSSKDTRQKLREEMDTLALAMAKEANKLRGADNAAVKLDTLKHVTAYLSMANREPEQAEGADILKFRDRIARANPGGGDRGDASERGPDESEPDEGDEPDSLDPDAPGEAAA